MLAVLMLVSISCEDMLDIEPKQSIDFGTALTTRDGVVAAINGVYSRMRSLRLYGRDITLLGDALSDIGRTTNNSGRFIAEQNNNNRAHFVQETWQQAYFAINEINLIIEAIPGLNDPLASAADKGYYLGSMKFMRALLHFELARIYAYDPGVAIATPGVDKGGIPIRIVATKTVEEALALKVPRDPVADVYAQIYADLDDAIANIPASITNRFTANLGAAHALYARVALYNKDYAKAISEADLAIASTVGTLQSLTNYIQGWRSGTSNTESYFEIRFQIAAENNGVNEALQTSINSIRDVSILGIGGATGQVCTVGGWGDLIPDPSILTDLQLTMTGADCASRIINRGGTDIRGFLYEIGNGRGSGNKIENIKYLAKSGQVNLDNAPVLRASEPYLIKAEAAMSLTIPDEVTAHAALNIFKLARYTGYDGSAMEIADDALTGAALFNEIMRQRKLEFAFEGHRWFDLKRRGQDIVKSPNTVPYNDYRILPPLPQSELDGNPNLEQNYGY